MNLQQYISNLTQQLKENRDAFLQSTSANTRIPEKASNYMQFKAAYDRAVCAALFNISRDDDDRTFSDPIEEDDRRSRAEDMQDYIKSTNWE